MAIMLTAVLGTPASGQACGMASGLELVAAAGVAGYEMGAGADGGSWGGDVAARTGLRPALDATVEGGVGYRRLALRGGSDPHVVRSRVGLALPIPFVRLSACPTLHAGASLLPLAGHRYDVWAGGVGLRLAADALPLSGARAVPFLEVRGLAGHSTGSVYGLDAGETGLALGVETGVQVTMGSLVLRATAALDGFDDGLGVTPYPSRAAELTIGVGF